MEVKKYDYFWARTIIKITGIVFLSQLILELSGAAQRKPGFEWVIYMCGVLFGCSVLYCMLLISLNALDNPNK